MSSVPEPTVDRVTLRRQRRFRRWALRLFASHLVLVALTVMVLVAKVSSGDMGQKTLFLGGVLTAIALPVWIVTMVLATISLVRGEPRPQIAIFLLVACLLLALTVAPIGLGMLRDAVESLG